MIKYFLGILVLLSVSMAYIAYSPAQSFSEEPMPEYLMEEDWEPLQVTGGAIAWEVFATTKEHESCTMGDDGYDICLIKPEYSKAVKALDGKHVTLMGYMFPLEQSEKHKNFLIGPYPLSCPFHYHVGPTQMVEVFTEEPIALSYEPISLEGTLQLRFNEDTGVFYYLNSGREL
ncbi:MAG: DUF3299 domain-containing protein [Rickettsiales bacterium]|nr:DUF3299 domain-containing protein [Rickettsiales bacterium]